MIKPENPEQVKSAKLVYRTARNSSNACIKIETSDPKIPPIPNTYGMQNKTSIKFVSIMLDKACPYRYHVIVTVGATLREGYFPHLREMSWDVYAQSANGASVPTGRRSGDRDCVLGHG